MCCALTAGIVSACGFQPLHGRANGERGSGASGSTISDMAYVRIAPIADRAGLLVRNRLLDRMHPRGLAEQPVFRLTVVLSESREGLAFQQDDSATRFNLRLSADFKLIDTRDGSELLQGTARAIAAYANLISQRDARRRAAHNVAEGIQDRIAVYFSRRRG